MTLGEAFAAAPRRDDLVVSGDRRLSSDAVDDIVASLAAGLRRAGVCEGDRVAFQFPTVPEAILLYRACWRLGAVAAALHSAAGAEQVAAALAQLDAAVVIADQSKPLAAVDGARGFDELVGSATPLGQTAISTGEDSDALVLFTSGSSGAPKGVVHTHGSLLYKARQSIEVHGLGPQDAILMPAPLAHMSGLLHAVTVPGVCGFKAVLMPVWDAGLALSLIEAEQITYMVGPPTFFIGLMDHDAFAPSRVESLRMLSCGGAGVSPAFAERSRAELGVVVKRAYGSTEAPTVTTSRFDDPPHRMISTDGRTFGETRVRTDDAGEIWAYGPELARGYLDPRQTAEAFVDGWFRTGDLGTIDDGWLTITGRLGDRIIRGGENISASEVEAVLEAHPAVAHAVAVAEPDERLGERVAAFVVAEPGSFDLAVCREWFRERGVSRFTCPERVEVIDAVPVLASGKPDRSALRARL